MLHGVACDSALQAYRQSDVDGALVAAGETVGVYGQKPDGSDWVVSILNPDASLSENDTLGLVSIDSGCLASVGSNQNYFTQDGQKYHDILDPRTGRSAQSGLLSVTVWHEQGAVANMLAAACFVLGQEQSRALLAHFGAEAVFVTEEHQVMVTDGLSNHFELQHGRYTISA